jgi:hypothetical protein
MNDNEAAIDLLMSVGELLRDIEYNDIDQLNKDIKIVEGKVRVLKLAIADNIRRGIYN